MEGFLHCSPYMVQQFKEAFAVSVSSKNGAFISVSLLSAVECLVCSIRKR